jgi:Synaptobrevin/VAMP-like protein
VYSRAEGVAGVIVARESYPDQVAHSLLRKLLDDFLTKYPTASFSGILAGKSFPLPELKEYIIKYQDPNQADNITKVQNELNETKQILHKTIEQVSSAFFSCFSSAMFSSLLLPAWKPLQPLALHHTRRPPTQPAASPFVSSYPLCDEIVKHG